MQKRVTKTESQLVEKIDEMRSRTSSRFPRSDSKGHQTDSKSGSSSRREACERAQSSIHVGPPLLSRFQQRCELVKRSCLANSIQHKKSRRQCEDLSGCQMRRRTQAHSDDANPKVPADSAEKQIIQEQAKISQSK